MTSLRRFKDEVKEVNAGTECGMTLDNFEDIKIGDVIEVFEQEEMTKVFVKSLNDLNLLVPQTLSLKDSKTGENHDISGFYIVDKKKLIDLPDDKLLELRKSGALEVIHNHIMSLESLDKLLRLKNISRPADTAATGMEDESPAVEEAPSSE